jgi:hypothetical protein
MMGTSGRTRGACGGGIHFQDAENRERGKSLIKIPEPFNYFNLAFRSIFTRAVKGVDQRSPRPNPSNVAGHGQFPQKARMPNPTLTSSNQENEQTKIVNTA